MPTLRDPRHELFCQNIATGIGATDAYEAAGYARHRQNASRLMTRADIRCRIAELLDASAAATVEVETAKRRAIRTAYERLADAIATVEVVTAQELRHLAAAVLDLEKDQRVVDGGVSDRTESGSATGRLVEELRAAEEWLAKLTQYHAGLMAPRIEA